MNSKSSRLAVQYKPGIVGVAMLNRYKTRCKLGLASHFIDALCNNEEAKLREQFLSSEASTANPKVHTAFPFLTVMEVDSA